MNKRQQTSSFEDNMDDDGLDEEFDIQFESLVSQALTQREQTKSVSTSANVPIGRNTNEMGKPQLTNNIYNNNIACNSLNRGKLYSATAGKPNSSIVEQKFPIKRSGGSDTFTPEKRLCPESTVYASRQKKLEDPKVKELNEEIRELKAVNAKMEEKLKSAQDETRELKECKEEHDRHNQNQQKIIQKLESQLAFQKIEANCSQINQVQKSVSVKQNGNLNGISTGINLANCDPSSKVNSKSNFPTKSSFSKSLPKSIISVPNSTCSNMRVVNEPDPKNAHIKLKSKCKSVEVLLLKSIVRPLERLSVNSLLPPLISIPSIESEDTSNACILKPISKVNLEAAQLKEAIDKLIENERNNSSNELSCFTQNRKAFTRFNVEIGYPEIFLRFIEYNLVFPSEEEKMTNESVELSIDKCLQSLHLLKCLVNCSVQLKHCILHKNDLTNDDDSSCNILKTLFKFFRPTVQALIIDNTYVKMMETILEILNELGNNAEVHHMTKFLPLLNPGMIKVCKSHLHYPEIFMGFVRLFATLFASPEIIKATCQEAICLWAVLAPSWVEMATKYSSNSLMQLDQQMCKLLLQSLSIENFKPPFIDAVDCHCSCDVGISLVNFLYRYKIVFEATGKISNVSDLQHGLEVLYHLAASDPNIDERVKAKYMSFLRWLNRTYKTENLGHFAEVVLDKYYPITDDHSPS